MNDINAHLDSVYEGKFPKGSTLRITPLCARGLGTFGWVPTVGDIETVEHFRHNDEPPASRQTVRVWLALLRILAREVVGFRARIYVARLWGSHLRASFKSDKRYFFSLVRLFEQMASEKRRWHAFTAKGQTFHIVTPDTYARRRADYGLPVLPRVGGG